MPSDWPISGIQRTTSTATPSWIRVDSQERPAPCISCPSNTTVTNGPVQLFSASSSELSEPFWLNDYTVVYLNGSSLYSIPINYTAEIESEVGRTHLLDFPAGIHPSGLLYEPNSGVLAFTGMVWEDGEL